MLNHRSPLPLALLVAVMLSLAACSGSGQSTTSPTASADASSSTSGGLDISLFADGALAKEPTTEDCTLSGGATTTCYRITVTGWPTDHAVGPFCPTTITDGAEKGGIWFDGEQQYDLTGPFIKDLATTYNDDGWHMYDDQGNVLITETQEAFDGAARPQVDPQWYNHCIQGKVEWLPDGKPVTTEVLIPTTPVAASAPAESRGNLGVTLDGVVIAAPAPVSAILGAYTIAAFDDCGGHLNPHDGYHMHGAVGCSEVGEASEGDTPMFGYAADGYPVHSPFTDEQAKNVELDTCNGHTTEANGYHYHANQAAKKRVIQCMVGQTATPR